MKLSGRGIVITGANQGLGKAIAEMCESEGAHVLLRERDEHLLAKNGEKRDRKTGPA